MVVVEVVVKVVEVKMAVLVRNEYSLVVIAVIVKKTYKSRNKWCY